MHTLCPVVDKACHAEPVHSGHPLKLSSRRSDIPHAGFHAGFFSGGGKFGARLRANFFFA